MQNQVLGWRAVRERKTEDTLTRSVVRNMSVGSEEKIIEELQSFSAQTFRGFREPQAFGTSELQLLIPTFARFLSGPFEKRSLLRGAGYRNGWGCSGFGSNP